MYVRVVRFTDVTPDQMAAAAAQVKESGLPPGVSLSSVQMLFDSEHQTAVVLQHFDTAAEMEAAARAFDAMDASETPGTRVSVDSCEVRLDLKP